MTASEGALEQDFDVAVATHKYGAGQIAYFGDTNTEDMLSHINVGTGIDISILELAQMVAEVTSFKGRIETDPSKPDGTMRKLMDPSRLRSMGWTASIGLREGLESTYRWFLDNQDSFRS